MALAPSSMARSAALLHPFSSSALRQPAPFQHAAHSRSRRSGPGCVAAASRDSPECSTDRRSLLMSIAAGMGLALSPAASAADTEEMIKEALKEKAQKVIKDAEAEGLSTFFGTASPPTSYGGYGGNASEDAKYFFKYPTGWKTDVINKTQKGTQGILYDLVNYRAVISDITRKGIDCRVYNPKNKKQQVFVITFSRAGEDNKSFKVTDIENTFAGFAGADYDLQDAISEATDKKTGERELEGSKYYDVEIDSPTSQYLSTITVASGKVFAMFVKSPTKLWAEDEAKLRAIQQSFRTIARNYARSGPE